MKIDATKKLKSYHDKYFICSFHLFSVWKGARNKYYLIPTFSTIETFKTKYFCSILFIAYLL